MEGFWISSAIHAIKALSYVYDLLTFPVYLILQRPWEKRKASRRIKARPISKNDNQITYRSVDSPKAMHIMLEREKIDTLEKMFLLIVKQHGDKKCLGTRQILAEEDEPQPNGRVFKKVRHHVPERHPEGHPALLLKIAIKMKREFFNSVRMAEKLQFLISMKTSHSKIDRERTMCSSRPRYLAPS